MSKHPPRPLFAFGTLRRGESNHHYLAGRYERVLVATLPGYTRGVAAHGFPAVFREASAEGDDSGVGLPTPGVSGELFFLRPDLYDRTLAEVDGLEDIIPGTLSGPYYERCVVTVRTEDGECDAWAYVTPEPRTTSELPTCES